MSAVSPAFEHLDVGTPSNGTIELRLVERLMDPPMYGFSIFAAGTSTKLGDVLLRLDSSPTLARAAGNIGYEIDPAHRGHRYAAQACALLAPLARRHGLDELWILAAPDNLASCRSAELVGAQLIDTVAVTRDSDLWKQGNRSMNRYRWRL